MALAWRCTSRPVTGFGLSRGPGSHLNYAIPGHTPPPTDGTRLARIRIL